MSRELDNSVVIWPKVKYPGVEGDMHETYESLVFVGEEIGILTGSYMVSKQGKVSFGVIDLVMGSVKNQEEEELQVQGPLAETYFLKRTRKFDEEVVRSGESGMIEEYVVEMGNFKFEPRRAVEVLQKMRISTGWHWPSAYGIKRIFYKDGHVENVMYCRQRQTDDVWRVSGGYVGNYYSGKVVERVLLPYSEGRLGVPYQLEVLVGGVGWGAREFRN